MKNRLQGLLKDRKILYLVLCIAVVSVFTLSIAYAAMSAVLEIHGNSEVVASSWNIYMDNWRVTEGSVIEESPVIVDNATLYFAAKLSKPGDYYEVTVDIVNDGSIDALIDNVVKTPNLTSEQAKYIKYEITYENGESISTKQTLKKGTSTPIKVRVEYRKDIVASDLPSSATELSLKLTLIYVQSDGSGSSIPNNGASTALVNVVSGDGTQVGNEVCIKNECFYVISSTDSTVTMLSKYNLHVGNSSSGNWNVIPLTNPTGIQDESAKGYIAEQYPWIGTTAFSSDSQKGEYYSDYSGSIVEGYVNNYNSYLITQGVTPIEARLMTKDELISLGCSNESCSEASSWIYDTSYWVVGMVGSTGVYTVSRSGSFNIYMYNEDFNFGVRPVITISRDYL